MIKAPDKPKKPQAVWLNTAEKGSALGIRLLVWLATVSGRGPALWVLRIVAFYYTLIHGKARRASRRWLTLARGRPATFWDAYRHIFVFAQVALDRLFFLRGKADGFTFHHNGARHLRALARDGKGAILLCAHLGSQAAMNAEGYDRELRLNIVGYFKNAAMLNSVLGSLNPESQARFVHVSPEHPSSVLEIRERVDRGEIVAIAADRVGLNERTVAAPFFGRQAPFPLAPFILASILKAPVCLAIALYHAPDRYELYCEPFADTLAVPRRDRQAALQVHVQRYAERLEHYARISPENWFNFFDFHDPYGKHQSDDAQDAPSNPGATQQ